MVPLTWEADTGGLFQFSLRPTKTVSIKRRIGIVVGPP